jgi:hypothetical protein
MTSCMSSIAWSWSGVLSGVYKNRGCTLLQAQLDGSCFPVLCRAGPISCSYPRGFESHRGPPFFGG